MERGCPSRSTQQQIDVSCPVLWRQCPSGEPFQSVIIDEDCFYVGSDNMYPSADKEGLQEFGYLIEDKKETQKFIKEYWDKLWTYSGKPEHVLK